jgi:hypothetical protein
MTFSSLFFVQGSDDMTCFDNVKASSKNGLLYDGFLSTETPIKMFYRVHDRKMPWHFAGLFFLQASVDTTCFDHDER